MPHCNLADLGIHETRVMLDQIVPVVEKKFLNDHQYLKSLSINNIEISNRNSSFGTYSIANADSLYFEIFTDYKRHIETLKLSISAIDKICKTLSNCSELSFKELTYRLSVSVELIDLTIKNIIQAHADFGTSNSISYPSGFDFYKLKIHLLSLFKAINTAIKTQDHVMLSDLLEYELKDNIMQWKIYVIPSIIYSVIK
jgi:hypothetical protein